MYVFDQHVLPYLKSGNREFYTLARDAYYRNNVFEIWVPTKDEEYDTPGYYNDTLKFKQPLPHIANQFRHLWIRVGFHYFRDIGLEELVMDPFEPGPWLFQAARHLNLAKLDSSRTWLSNPRNLSWQTDFSNLHTLYLKVDLMDWDELEYEDGRECCIGPGKLVTARQCLAETGVFLQARKVEVVLVLACANCDDQIEYEEHTDMLAHLVVLARKRWVVLGEQLLVST
jgi:hypothetical protein